MEVLEKIITQFNPVASQKPSVYNIFLGKGALPFTADDANGLWNEWRNALPNAKFLQKYPVLRDPTAVKYGSQWTTERAKFYRLFEQFITFETKGLVPSILFVYPNGKEMKWTASKSELLDSQRGLLLAKALKAMKSDGDFALAGIVQYQYNDNPELYKSTSTGVTTRQLNTPVNTNSLVQQIQNLKVNQDFGLLPIVTDKPLPYNVLDNFWFYYRNNSVALKNKYGAGPAYDKQLFDNHKNVYEQGNITKVFDFFVKLDSEMPKDKLLMISFIYDIGEQHVLFRLGGKSLEGQADAFRFGTLPATEGTKQLIAKIPENLRAVICAVYSEELKQ